jgi:hypothetical protein
MKKFLFFAIILSALNAAAQTPITLTAPGSGSGGSAYSPQGTGVTFSIRNNNPYQIAITDIDAFSYGNPNTLEVWYTGNPTQVTGSPNVSTANGWTKIATAAVSGTNGVKNLVTGAFLLVPAGAIYRFAIWIPYPPGFAPSGGSATIVSNGGVDLLTGSNSISNGLMGAWPAPTGVYSFIGAVTFLPAQPCIDKPNPGDILGPNPVCPLDSFWQVCYDSNFVTGKTYQWQYSKNGKNWAHFIGVGSNKDSMMDQIASTTWYRCIVTCVNSGLKDTTDVKKVDIADFYYCYCKNKASVTTGLDVGNVKVEYVPSVPGAVIPEGSLILNNGNPLPMTNNTNAKNKYTTFQYSVPPIGFYRDTTYKFTVSAITSTAALAGGAMAVFIDLDRDGMYGKGEKVLEAVIPTSGTATSTFKIPVGTQVGYTGMRVIVKTGGLPVDSCGYYGEGETEDYIAEIKYEPCNGPINPGTVLASDTSACKNYDYMVSNVAYERQKSNFRRMWMVSADNQLWFDVPNGLNNDTLMRVFDGQPVFYKVRAVCLSTNDTTYTPPTRVNLKNPVKCYCFSQAVGGLQRDSSDIGGFSLGNVVTSDGGTHLQNAKAINKRTDHTDDAPIEMYTDSVFNMTVFHTIWTTEHGDAKVTVFMDFNNDHMYRVSDGDRVYLGYTSFSTFTLVDKVTVPPTAIMNVPTGMRIILNNDIGPNIPSDEACGTYWSGETEDYMIIFRNKGTSVNRITGIKDIGLYPNPTTGKFMLTFNSDKKVKEINVNITDVTGRTVKAEAYSLQGGTFRKELDMTGYAKGVYLVELATDGQKMTRKLVVE